MREPRTLLESELARLPEPEPPAGLSEAVMARVARVDLDRRKAARDAAEEERPGAVPAGGGKPFHGRGRLAAALGAAGLAGYVYGLERGAWTFDPLASPIGDGFTALVAFPQSVTAALGLTMVMLLYLVGLLAPLGRNSVSDVAARPPVADRGA